MQAINYTTKHSQRLRADLTNANSISEGMLTNATAPIDVVFHKITYTVAVKDKRARTCQRLPDLQKRILKGVTGIIKHGRVTAIMGASGAGKTSLLNILACRITPNRKVQISGSVLVNMRPYTYETFGDFANYVMQNDILMQTLTVRETLEFAAAMTLNVPQKQRNIIIDRLINDLKLDKCANVLVGGHDIKGISGGERKRTSIAFELVSDPQVVFMDEPTSGLDSLTAYVIVWYMKKLTHNCNKTVAMTIHQPSSEIFSLFDDLILMVEGRLVYQGLASESVQYFSQMGFRCPEFSNPPDYFMSIMHHESKKNVSNYPKYYQTYNLTLAAKVKYSFQASERGLWPHRRIKTSFCRRLATLLWRDMLNIKRNPNYIVSRVLQVMLVSTVIGALFWKLGNDYSTPEGLSKGFYSKNGLLFFLGVGSFLGPIAAVVITFPLEKAVFLRQQSNRMYSTFSYFLSRNITQLPILFLAPLLSSLIIYWMVDLHSGAGYFFMFFFITLLCNIAGNAFGFFVGSFFDDARNAAGFIPMVVLPFMVFGGYFKNKSDIPGWVGWIEYISPLKYAFLEFATNEYHNTTAPIQLLNFDMNFWLSIGLMWVIIVVAKILTLIALTYMKTKLQ